MSLTRAFSRTNKGNGRDPTPPTSPKRTYSKRQNAGGAQEKPAINKFKISAPVELISTTNMISYTSPSLRSSMGGAPSSITSSPNPSILGHKSQTSISAHKSNGSISLKTEQNIKQGHYYPPSPASSGGSLPPLSPEIGTNIDEILTPPATPPPNHLTEYFPKRERSSNSSAAGSVARSSTSSTAMEHRRQISRIKSVSSINSSTSSGSSDRYSKEREREELPALPAELTAPRRVNTFGNTPSAPQLKTHKSTISNVSTSSLSSQSLTSAPPAITSPVIVPTRSSARVSRSVSNPTLRSSAKSHRHHSSKTSAANPFAHELAKVSELAEDMGVDLDDEAMFKKGLQKFSAGEYLDLIWDVMYYQPSVSTKEKEKKREIARTIKEEPEPEFVKPVVPLRKKPSILRREEEERMRASPAIVNDGGWI
ncbi:hypothetical protein ABW19_dt0200498 [Dactylella cylindrospora]|nr:hypothetical protein ABW19_dt0200498 [Dactylella cylindrospora]